jgi:hypothetical protein
VGENNTYKVVVKTSDIRGAGTDSNVKMVLFGEKDGKVREASTRPWGFVSVPEHVLCNRKTPEAPMYGQQQAHLQCSDLLRLLTRGHRSWTTARTSK